MNSLIGNLPKSLLLLPLLGVTAPKSRAAEPSLLPLEPGATTKAGDLRFSHDITQIRRSPIAPAPSGAVEAFAAQTSDGDSPLIIAQVIPTPGAVNTQVELDASGTDFQITGGTQTGENLFHRFDQLDLNAGQIADFEVHPGVETILSEIGSGPSNIDGLLKVSGGSADLFVINPAGVVLGPNAQLDLSGSFVATTADRLEFSNGEIDLLDEGFTEQTVVSGSLDSLGFSAHAAGGVIVNQGQLAVDAGQSIGLLGHAVINTGELKAPGGEVTVLAAKGGQQVSLQGELLNLELAAPVADGSSNPVLWNNASQSLVEATGLSQNTDGSISLAAGTVRVSGDVDVSSVIGAGGTATLLGDQVQVVDAVVDASGAEGGLIRVGGDYQGQGKLLRASATQVDTASVLRADGGASTLGIRPDGGEVIVWSDGTTEFAGTATAQSLAPGGEGGLVETSAKQQLAIAPTANVNTTSVDGATGQWLIDPVDLTVVNGGGAGSIVGGTNSPAGASTIDAATIEAGLNGNNVVLQADNSITVNAPIDASANPSGGDLELDAPTLNLNERVMLVAGSDLSGTATTVNVGANGGVQNGVDAVATGGTVNLAVATYREGQEIIIDKSLTLQGQGAEDTTISGDADNNGDGDHRVLEAMGAGNNIVLQQLTIADGRTGGIGASGGGLTAVDVNLTIADAVFRNNRTVGNGSQDGGAFHQADASVTVTRSQFIDNQSTHDGGAINLQSGSLNISDSTFTQNIALSEGGAIDNDRFGSLTITNSNFSDNTAALRGGAIMIDANVGAVSVADSNFSNNSSGNGGAILIDRNAGPISITGGNFSNNTADDGGAIFTESAVEIAGSNFTDNIANESGGALLLTSSSSGNSIQGSSFIRNQALAQNGGAIDAQVNSSLQLSANNFTQNQAQRDGGAIRNDGVITLSDTTLTNNQSVDRRGGAIHLSSNGRLTITNSNFTGNQAGDHGGALASFSTDSNSLTIDNSTFVNNHSDRFGGGLYLDSTNGRIDLFDVTLQNNTAQDGGGLYKLDGATLEIIGNSRFEDNIATRFGGGLVNDRVDGDVNLIGTLFRNNDASDDGGAIHLRNGSQLTGEDLTFLNNTAQDGGAIDLSSGTQLSLTDSIFQANQATTGGAIDVDTNSQLNLTRGSFRNNSSLTGGAIRSDSGQITADRTEFINNQAGISGGAIVHAGSAIASLTNVTFTGNTADRFGGAIFNEGDVNSQLEISGSDFSQNQVLSSNSASGDGGAISIRGDGATTISATDFSENQATFDGGAIANSANSGQLTITGSQFIENQAVGPGGAIDNQGRLTIDQSSFTRNQTTSTTTGNGGAIANRFAQAELTIDQTSFVDNQSSRQGGGVFNFQAAALTVTNSSFEGGSATLGGGIYSGFSPADIADSHFEGNEVAPGATTGDGAAIYNLSGDLTVVGSTFVDNQATDFGGAILSSEPDATLVVQDSDFTNNRARIGGAVHQFQGQLTVEDSDFLNNQADQGGALNVVGLSAGSRIQNSLIQGNQSTTTGGGINLASDAELLLTEVVLDQNQADQSGGGLAAPSAQGFSGNLEIVDSSFTNNQAGQNGGGLFQENGSLQIRGSQFIDNVAQRRGGGLNLTDVSNAVIEQTLLEENQAINLAGGGASLEGNTNLTLTQSILRQNQAVGTGGALSAQESNNFSGDVTVSDSSFEQNLGSFGGAIHFNPSPLGGTLSVEGSSFIANQAQRSAGALQISDGAIAVIERSTFSGNQANETGGAIRSGGNLTIERSTIANNISDVDTTGDGRGGGILQQQGQVSVSNSIVAQNQVGSDATAIAADLSGNFQDLGNNLIGIADGATGLTSSALLGSTAAPLNPLLGPLGNYGGLTQTLPLLPGSPAIDAANASVLDQRGIAQVSVATDVGAFESQGFVAPPSSGTPQSTEINTAFADPLTLVISSTFGEPVDGGQINYAAPASGASIDSLQNPISVAITGGIAQLPVTANALEGQYDVVATAAGVAPLNFSLTNLPTPTPLPLPEPTPAPIPTPEPTPLTPSPPTRLTPLTSPPPPETPSISFLERPIDFPQTSLNTSALGQPTLGQPPLSLVNNAAIQVIDQVFSSEFTSYWQTATTEGSPISQLSADTTAAKAGSSVEATQEILREAGEAHGVKSAVVYGLFVPQDKAAAEGFGATQVANMALTRRAQTDEQRDDDQLMVVLVPDQGSPITRLVDVTRQELMQQVRLFRMAVSDPEDDWSYQPLARQMQSWLFAPIQPDVERLELEHVMYALASGLRAIPLVAMMDGDEFVIERYGISLIPSVDLLETDFGSSAPPPQTLAAGANEFEQLEDLPAVEVELNAIATQASEGIAEQRSSVDVLFNQDFTLMNLVEAQNQSQASMIHLATHAEFNAGDLGSSYLQFWDDQLTLDDISKLGWDELELLILSACQTAISSPEAELGFAGLAAATGVESTIGSLWSVSDIGTLGLMSEFYGQLAQTPLRFEALRQAQMAMLRGETRLEQQQLQTERGEIDLPEEWDLPESADFSHPFYWSGFTLVGNPWW